MPVSQNKSLDKNPVQGKVSTGTYPEMLRIYKQDVKAIKFDLVKLIVERTKMDLFAVKTGVVLEHQQSRKSLTDIPKAHAALINESE